MYGSSAAAKQSKAIPHVKADGPPPSPAARSKRTQAETVTKGGERPLESAGGQVLALEARLGLQRHASNTVSVHGTCRRSEAGAA